MQRERRNRKQTGCRIFDRRKKPNPLSKLLRGNADGFHEIGIIRQNNGSLKTILAGIPTEVSRKINVASLFL